MVQKIKQVALRITLIFLICIVAVGFSELQSPKSGADLLQCPYPAVNNLASGGVNLGLNAGGPAGNGNAGANLNVNIGGTGYYCVYPMEYNGSALWCKYTIVNVIIVSASLEGCAYRCPDGRRAYQPNPPGAWKDRIRKFKVCRPIDPNEPPFAPPVEGIQPVDMSPNPGEPGYVADNDNQTGVVVNPDKTNPLALDPQGK